MVSGILRVHRAVLVLLASPGGAFRGGTSIDSVGQFDQVDHQAAYLNSSTLINQVHPKWASADDLSRVSRCQGSRIGVGPYEVEVGRPLGSGKAGSVYLATVVKPPEQQGQKAVLKVQIAANVVDPLADEAKIMKKMRGIPHASQLLAFGKPWRPSSLFGKTFPTYGTEHVLLTTIAPGSELADQTIDDDAKSQIKIQLNEFAEEMFQRGLIHADLTMHNVFWDAHTKQATVIDFGNSQDVNADAKTRKQYIARLKFKNARHEMSGFLEQVDSK
mmetsp:Transcript_89209/g.232549  ORF Transcript_89209/g.232549 Transcript_89209/m.232549 type:complete len:274 (-) Transcript_89209:52-873(-)